jgi:hypothetical protein
MYRIDVLHHCPSFLSFPVHLVPATAIVREFPEPRTLADLQQALVHTRSDTTLQMRYRDDVISIGCGSVPVQESMVSNDDSTSPRRRLAMVDNASVCNNVTNFYCWMSCLDIPEADQAQQHLESGHGLYCVDPSVMHSTNNNLTQAVEPCIGEDGLFGSAMNEACVGSWRPKVDHLAAVPISLDESQLSQEEPPYCYGGSVMFHEGFQWKSTTCAILLFPQWVLSTQGQFIAGCFGTVLLGVLVEFILFQRRKVMKHMEQSSRAMRLTMSAIIYGLQLTIGYMVMLVVMIYSAPLFVAVIGGLALGHVLFNAKDAVFSTSARTTAVTAQGTLSEEDGTDKASQSRSCSEDNDHAEGITPCCQHTL